MIVLLLILPLCQIPTVKANPGWLPGWDKRVKIEIDSGDVDSNLASFPVLIFLSNSSSGIYDEDVSFIFDEIGENWQKIALTVGETVETFVEVEKWNASSIEEAWLHTNVTATSASNQTLYLYYDKDHANNTDYVDITKTGNSVNVWDSDFAYVYHMRDKTTSSVADSTSNNNDGTKKGANEPIVTLSGEIDDAQDFDGSDDYISNLANFGSIYTIEAWASKDDDAEQFFHGGKNQQYSALVGYTSVGNRFFAVKHGSDGYIFTDAITWGTLYYVTYIVDGTSHEILKNGILKDSAITANTATSDTDVYIGRRSDGRYWNGIVDEIRLSTIVRSDPWINATYASQIDHLLDYGTEEVRPPIYSVTFYNNTGGILRVDNITVANGTETEYLNNTELELIAIVEGNLTYGFANFTWNGNYNFSNPYNWTIIFAVSNLTLWCYFGAITEEPAFSGIVWLLVAGLMGAVIAIVLFSRRD